MLALQAEVKSRCVAQPAARHPRSASFPGSEEIAQPNPSQELCANPVVDAAAVNPMAESMEPKRMANVLRLEAKFIAVSFSMVDS